MYCLWGKVMPSNGHFGKLYVNDPYLVLVYGMIMALDIRDLGALELNLIK